MLRTEKAVLKKDAYTEVVKVKVTRTPPPLAQARPRSHKSGQNGGSTPTPC